MASRMPESTASCPMYKWQKPPNFCWMYSWPQRSSNFRMRYISRNQRVYVSLFRPFADFLAAGLRPAFAGFLGAAVAVGCEVAIAFGLTFKYSVPPHPFAGPRSRATHQLISCTKYTIASAPFDANPRAPRNERLATRVVPSRPSLGRPTPNLRFVSSPPSTASEPKSPWTGGH